MLRRQRHFHNRRRRQLVTCHTSSGGRTLIKTCELCSTPRLLCRLDVFDSIKSEPARTFTATGLLPHTEPDPGVSVSPAGALEALRYTNSGARDFLFV